MLWLCCIRMAGKNLKKPRPFMRLMHWFDWKKKGGNQSGVEGCVVLCALIGQRKGGAPIK